MADEEVNEVPTEEPTTPMTPTSNAEASASDCPDSLETPKVLLSQTKSLSTSDNDLQPTSPISRGIKYSQSLRVKRDGTSKADRSGWSLGNMAKALGTGVVQGTKAVGSGVVQVSSGVVQGTKAVGTGVVQGSLAVGTGVVQGSLAVGSGVVQGTKAVGTGVVQGTKVVGTGVVAAGRMTKDVTIAVGKGVYHASEVVGSAAVTGVSAASDATLSAGRVVTSTSVSAVMETTKWVKEQSESFGGDDNEGYTVLPGDTLESVAEAHGVSVYDLIRYNNLQRRALIPGRQVAIPEPGEQIKPHSDEIFVAKAFMTSGLEQLDQQLLPEAGDEIDGILRFSTMQLTFTANGVVLLNVAPVTNVTQLQLSVVEIVDSVPELLPADSLEEKDTSGPADFKSSSSSNSLANGDAQQLQQRCHIIEVDLDANLENGGSTGNASGMVTSCSSGNVSNSVMSNKRKRINTNNTNTDDVFVLLEIGVTSLTPDLDSVPMTSSLEVDEESTSTAAKLHLFTFKFPQADLSSVHSYMELWHADKLTVSDDFQKHLLLESSGLEDIDFDVGPTTEDASSILDERHMREIYRSLPHKIQNQSWALAYSTRVNGFSLQNLYRTIAEESSPFLIVIQDANGFIFGSYLTCTPRISESFIGTGKSWLFSFGRIEFAIREEEEEEVKAANETNDVATEESHADDAGSVTDGGGAAGGGGGGCGEVEPTVVNPHHINVYHWSGRNEYFFRGTLDNVIIGASDGKFGILIDGDLHKGRIQECATFEGWPAMEQDFIISCLECWHFM